VTSHRFGARNRVAIAGFAQSPITRHADTTLGVLTIQTIRDAVADAGLTMDQVDGLVTAPLFPSVGSHAATDGHSLVTTTWLARRLGLDPRFAADVQGQLPVSVAIAVNAVASGAADHVVLHRALHNPRGQYHASSSSQAGGMAQWSAPQGFFGPIAAIAMAYNEYAHRYGIEDGALGDVVVEARKNGSKLPWSYWYGQPLTRDEYLAAPVINDPIRRLDCDLPVDGVTAFVFTSAERARDLPHRPVHVTGYSFLNGTLQPPRVPPHWPYDDIMDGGRQGITTLWEGTGVGPAEIDLPQFYDGFAPIVFFWLELLGICGPGEAPAFVRGGGIDSDKPDAVAGLSGGGALGNGRMHGTPQMLECYLQLAGRAGARQREGLSLALACQGPPHVGGAVMYSAEAF